MTKLQCGLALVLCVVLAGCTTTSSEQTKQTKSPTVQSSTVASASKYAMIWGSRGQGDYVTKLVSYDDDQIDVIASSNNLNIATQSSVWRLSTAQYSVQEGNCSTKGGVQVSEKEGLVLAQYPLSGGLKQRPGSVLNVTNPVSISNASYTQRTQILGSYGSYLFAEVCTDYQYCYGINEYPECEFVGYDLETHEQLFTKNFVKEYAFEDQMAALFPKILAKGGSISGDRSPYRVYPSWTKTGQGNFHIDYQIRVKNRSGNVPRWDDFVKQAPSSQPTSVKVTDMPPSLATHLDPFPYKGYFLVDASEVEAYKAFLMPSP